MKKSLISVLPAAGKVAFLALLVTLILVYVPYGSLEEMKAFINGFGVAAPLVFIIICILKPLIVFLPVAGLTIVAGTLFGPWYGTVYVVIGGAGSTAIGFYMTRLFGRKGIERIYKRYPWMVTLDEKMERSGFRTTLILRLFNLPWDMVSYSAGLSKMKFKDFYLASLVALAPTSFLYTYFGSALWNPMSPGFVISLSLIILLGAIPYIKNPLKGRA